MDIILLILVKYAKIRSLSYDLGHFLAHTCMNVYLFERLFNLGNNYARMRSCQVEGYLQIAQNINKMCQN